MSKVNSFSYHLFYLFLFVGLNSYTIPAHAQQQKLLDSVKKIFRSEPEKASVILDLIKRNAINRKDDKLLVEALIISGNIAYFNGKHAEALKIYLNGLAIAEKNNFLTLIASSCNEIGTLFKKNRDLEKSLEFYNRALSAATAINNNAQIANAFNNIGLVHEAKTDYGKALQNYQKSLIFYERENDKLGQSYSLEYIGYVYGLMNKYNQAITNLKKSLVLRQQLKDNYGIAICLIELTEVNKEKGDYDTALNFANKSIAFCKEINYPDMLQQGYLLLSQIYEKKRDLTLAYQAHKNYVNVKDFIFNAIKSKQINELQTKYETEKSRQKITLLNRENTIQKLKLSQQDSLLYIISFVLLLLAVVVYLLYNRNRLRQNAKLQAEVMIQQDLSTKAVLNAEENERKRIAGELHDGLGQMFSAVKLNLSALTDYLDFKDDHSKKMYNKTLSLVDESCKEVRIISHQMAPNVLLKSGLTTAVRDFIHKIDSRKLKVNLTTFGLQERLDQNIEIVLYRVIQEAVNNVIKHAEANSLDIQLTKDEEGITAMIEDNGKGFDAGQLDKFEGIGLKNIRTRVTFLKGTVEFSSSKDNGALIAIFIPFSFK